ncbi:MULTISPECIES: TAXI family TRAP transporter solute-binding subunit [Marivita]|uniref:TAXI family TRAP transporter solute-binding subunit n=1 Tax=Marivita cryptomonadis TaxID=505252 RepID=A0A9Q2NYM9_9RHOB|nr:MULTISPECIES: TAXI family TRAP transporter solute-binding subunit [Marivita]MCR9166785.1 TAXI family TRAP transporter solute-binding subunit [Paracoccaceae bacterium]MBM2321172.1 TAXI family TRAP transporter solute-binding subunit [Marivita cryptomonadis]MBM2330753.1 TAXI family TRAP transporter solute-binding subunit [Marivita cryptomonadis]MBM2340339.1 TAXI family TRAP transporter solute-binding subunit [Marivita cryptomonadis]MBM2345001.1 TAXI family TRAP transporter solute-binding subun
MKTLLTAAAVFLGATLATSASAQNVGIATSNPGSLFHNIGTAVANAANAAGLNTTIQPATSPNQFIPFIDQGGIEFGVANLQEVDYAVNGDAWWEGRTNPNLRVVAHLMPLVEAIFVRADSDIMKVSDLKGQPMTDGYTAQNTILPQLAAFYATAGMTRDDVEKVSVASVVAGADAFMAGDTVGFIFAHGAGKVREADAAVGGLRALGVEDESDAALAAARAHWPTAFFTTLPAGAMPGVLEDTVYIAFPQVVFTHAGASDDVVYAMTKAMYENAQVMSDTFPPFRAFKPADMKGEQGVAEYHPGALRFFEEVGLN